MYQRLKYLLRVLGRGAAITAATVVLPAVAWAQVFPTQPHGFGDRQNSYAWSMAWFKGQLYVGTNRNFLCVERATLQFYFPDVTYYSTLPDPGVPCPADPYDMNLQAEIWTFSPLTQMWTRVFQSPNDLINPIAPDKFVARDIGFRDMAVFTEPNGVQALYAAGVSAREYIPGLPPPRILRSLDGVTWTPIPQAPGTTLGSLNAVTFRAMKVYNGRLYVTASPGLTGDGFILESAKPWEGNNSFRQVSPEGMKVFELEVFNNFLYVGTGDLNTGYAVSRTKANGKPPYTFIPVVKDGAGRGSTMTSVVSMHPFKGRLYVGSSGWANGLWPLSELIRIAPDDKWDLVGGFPRFTDSGFKWPISGLPDSFGNAFNFHFWRMQAHQDTLFLGTNDGSYAFRTVPLLDPFISYEYGFDLFATADGVFWQLVTRNGFGSGSDFGARTMASTQLGLFGGTANHELGTSVLLGVFPPSTATLSVGGTTQIATADATLASTAAATTLAAPTRLGSERQGDVTVLSWDRSPTGSSVRVLRAEYSAAPATGPVRVPWSSDVFAPPGGFVELPQNLRLSQDFIEIGQTNETYFLDKTAAGDVPYVYYVESTGAEGQKGKASNIVYAPSLIPPATLSQLQAILNDLLAAGKIPERARLVLQSLLDTALAAVANGDAKGASNAVAALYQQVKSNRGVINDPLAAEDLEIFVSMLLRRTTLSTLGVIPTDSLR